MTTPAPAPTADPTGSGPGGPTASGATATGATDVTTAGSPATGSPATGSPATGSPATGSPATVGTGQVEALQAGLAAEHAVVWGYSVVGGKVGPELVARVRDADDAHRTRRDATVTLVGTYGGEPVATGSSYGLPFAVTDRRSALRLAVHLEQGAAAAWRYAVAATDDVAVRRVALAALADAAVRATRWRVLLPTSPTTVPFPGA